MGLTAEQLESDYKTAFKAGERLRIDTLRLIKAALQRVAIEKRKDKLEPQEINQVLMQQAKQRRDTIESVKNTPRKDVLDQATAELAIIQAYLPQAPSAETLNQWIDEAIKESGQNQGAIMKYVMGKTGGTVDGKQVSQLVAQRLRPASS